MKDNYLIIKDLKNKILYENNFSSFQEMVIFVNQNKESKVPYSLFKGYFITLRTNCFRNFCKDFFLPSFTSIALQKKSKKLKIFVSIPTMILDVTTLIVRMSTLFFRLIYNRCKKEEAHSIEKLIKNNPDSKRALEDGTVILNLFGKRKDSLNKSSNEEENKKDREISVQIIVHIKKVPEGCFKNFNCHLQV